MSFRDYNAVLAWLNQTTNFEKLGPADVGRRAYNLKRMRALLDALGRPEEKFAALHVAGTKGKGSVARMAEALLRTSGVRTGLYTSPHLMDVLERIELGGEPVRRRVFVGAMRRMKRAMDRVRPTFFEIMTAAAFHLFAERNVEVAVIEVGLGGRLDATNLCRPVGCAITRIDYDHTGLLGRTLSAIAGEKAGILKKGVPVVIAPQRTTAERALRRAARRIGAPVLDPPSTNDVRSHATRGRFVVKFVLEGVRRRIPVAGDHQAVNFAVALALVRTVKGPSKSVVGRTLGRIRLPGRIEWVRTRPDVVVDVAHNPASAAALRRTLDRVMPKRPRILVFGAPGDKDLRGMVRELLPGTRLAVLTQSADPRAAAPERLARMTASTPSVMMGNVPRAVALAMKAAQPRDVVVVAGSFVTVGEAMSVLRK